MERYEIVVDDEGDYCGLIPSGNGSVVKYADAQATVEALQAQVKQLEHGLTTQADAADMWYDEFLRIRALNASPEINGICDRALDGIPRTVPVVQENHQLRQQVEALQAIIKQMGEQACVLAKEGMAAKAQVEALQRERGHAKNMAAVQKEVADNQTWHVRELTAALDAEREKVQTLRDERDRLRKALEDIRDRIGNGALNVNWIKQYAEAALTPAGGGNER